MRGVAAVVLALLLLTSCQREGASAEGGTSSPPPPQAGAGAAAAATSSTVLGPPPGLATTSGLASEAIRAFRAEPAGSSGERVVTWDETLEFDVNRRRQFYHADRMDPTLVSVADRAALVALEAGILEQLCVNHPEAGRASGYEAVTASDCQAAGLETE